MKLKITVNTPKNQATKCVESQKNQLLGWKISKQIIESKVINHKQFYWILNIDDDQYNKLISNCAKGEILIKRFYKVLIKWINKGNKLATKFKQSSAWIRKWILKQARKYYKNNEDMIKEIESMTDEDVSNFLKIDDMEEMQKLLDGALIDVEQLE